MNIGDFPHDLAPYRWEMYLQPNTRSFQSPVTRTRQVLEGQGQRYVATGSWRFVNRRKAQRFEALLDKMKGQVNTVNVFDFAACAGPAGSATDQSTLPLVQFITPGSPDTLTAFITGATLSYFGPGVAGFSSITDYDIGDTSVTVRGFRQNDTPLYAGDNVEIGGYLYRLTEDAESDGIGWAELTLNRGLLTAVDADDPIVTTRPRTPMQLLDDDQSRRAIDAITRAREYTVSFVEVLPI